MHVYKVWTGPFFDLQIMSVPKGGWMELRITWLQGDSCELFRVLLLAQVSWSFSIIISPFLIRKLLRLFFSWRSMLDLMEFEQRDSSNYGKIWEKIEWSGMQKSSKFTPNLCHVRMTIPISDWRRANSADSTCLKVVSPECISSSPKHEERCQL